MLTAETDSLQKRKDFIKIEYEDSSEEELDKSQRYHSTNKSNCFNQLINMIYANVKKPPVELKITDEKVLEMLQPTRYKPSTVS